MLFKEITLEKARKIAEQSARHHLAWLIGDQSISPLREEYAEAECCWFFFRNNQLIGDPQNALIWDAAYAVSKKGTIRIVGDSSDDPQKLKTYIQRMSDHFKEKNL